MYHVFLFFFTFGMTTAEIVRFSSVIIIICKLHVHYKRTGYNIFNLNVIRQSACLVINPITVVINLLHSLIARWWIGRQTIVSTESSSLHLDKCFHQDNMSV